MMLSSRVRRGLAVGGVVALAVTVQGSVGNSATADTRTVYSGFTISGASGDPVYLKGDSVDCSAPGTPASSPAHLSENLTVTFATAPTNSQTETQVFIGQKQGFEFTNLGANHLTTPTTLTIPKAGGYNVNGRTSGSPGHFTCADVSSNRGSPELDVAVGVGGGNVTYGVYSLSKVD